MHNAQGGLPWTSYWNVTINTSTVSNPEQTHIGNAAFLSAGTQIIGNLVMGDMVVIGAGAIINNLDIPCGKIIYNDRNSREFIVMNCDTRRIFSKIFKYKSITGTDFF